jgi:alkylation response protein AidB-like acyl-CoA dehydrogenase
VASAELEPQETDGVLLAPDALADCHDFVAHFAARTRAAAGDIDRALTLARDLGADLPTPGVGQTRSRWSALATLGAIDLTVARVAEPHLDALAILAESGQPELADATLTGSTWGVYAAEGGTARLRARPNPGLEPQASNAWQLDGTKPWCSLAEVVDHALVTAWIGEDQRALFAVSLRQPGVTAQAQPGTWVSHGLSSVRSTPTSYQSAEATLVGAPGWYLQRDGFAWGGIGVAAIWFGGAVGVARRLHRQATERELDQIGWAHLGTVDSVLHAARSVLVESADEIDHGRADGESGALLALRVRQVVADAVELTIRVADHALGPDPLAFEDEHATRVSDLRVYVRQHHAERDTAALGRAAARDQRW